MIRIGVVLLMLGISMADSENLLIPLMFVSIGALILWRSQDVR